MMFCFMIILRKSGYFSLRSPLRTWQYQKQDHRNDNQGHSVKVSLSESYGNSFSGALSKYGNQITRKILYNSL